MRLFLTFLGAAACGSIPNAYWAGLLRGVDIRKHGSGNVGATNAFRVLGKGPGVAVLTLDFLKGFVPVFVAVYFLPPPPPALRFGEYALAVGAAAILGHMFTPFLGFRGGKGIATGAGVLAAGFPVLFALVLGTWLLVFFFSRIVSLSSILAVTMMVLYSYLLGNAGTVTGIFFAIAALLVWGHRTNLGRLMRGEEAKIGPKVNKTNIK